MYIIYQALVGNLPSDRFCSTRLVIQYYANQQFLANDSHFTCWILLLSLQGLSLVQMVGHWDTPELHYSHAPWPNAPRSHARWAAPELHYSHAPWPHARWLPPSSSTLTPAGLTPAGPRSHYAPATRAPLTPTAPKIAIVVGP
jgi:hypothetical protein